MLGFPGHRLRQLPSPGARVFQYGDGSDDDDLVRLRATPRFQTFLAKLKQEWEHIPGELESRLP
jgi:hypothetical protein